MMRALLVHDLLKEVYFDFLAIKHVTSSNYVFENTKSEISGERKNILSKNKNLLHHLQSIFIFGKVKNSEHNL